MHKTTNGKAQTILVTDCGRSNAIAVIRSLGRLGYHLVAADFSSDSLGFHSRYAHERLVYPAPESSPDAFGACLLEVVQRQRVDLIVPITDLAIQPLAQERRRFEEYTQLAIPSDALLQAVTDKAKTVAIAQRLGVPVPLTHRVETVAEALAKAGELGWPLVVKPQSSRQLHAGERIESFSVSYAGDAVQLQATMEKLEGHCAVLLQRYCFGTGMGVELLMSEGEPLAAFQHKRLREIPVTGGASAYRESVPLDPDLYRYAVSILAELRYTGLAMVEFKVSREGPVLMEINGRVWGSLPLAVASGMDFPGLMAKLYLEGREAISPLLKNDYELGVRCRDLQRDLIWIGQVLMQRKKYAFLQIPERKRAMRALVGILNPRRRFDLLVADDPLPGIFQLPRIVNKLRSKMNDDE